MSDLVLLLDEVELLLDNGVVLVAVLANLEQHFDHVLGAAVDIVLVQDVLELVEDNMGDARGHLLEEEADFAHEADSDLDTVIGWLLQQQDEDLAGEGLVDDLLVDEMGDEHGGRQANRLVVALESLAEAHDETLDEQFADLGQFGVDNSGHAGVDGRERQAGVLGLEETLAEQAAAADQVLVEQFRHDMLDVGGVDLVNQTVDRLLEGVPSDALILLRLGISDGRLQGAQLVRRQIHALTA